MVVVLSANMTIRLASGNAAPVYAGKDAIGFFFVGGGTFEYRSNDIEPRAVTVKFEAKKASDLTVTPVTQQRRPGWQIARLAHAHPDARDHEREETAPQTRWPR